MSTPFGSLSIDDKVAEAIRTTLLQRNVAAPTVGPVAKPVVEEKKEARPVVLGPNQKLASKVLGVKLKADEDFAVTVLDTATLPPQIAALVPSVDPDYKVQRNEALRLLRAWEENDPALIYGPTGSGKSSMVRHLCALTNRPFIRINLTRDTDSSMLFGSRGVDKGSTIWEDGPVTEAVKYGAVLLLDEWELMQPEISMGMQWLLEVDGHLFLKEMPGAASDKVIKPHANFRLVAGGNTQGQGDDTGAHAGTNVQNTATIDRFQTVIRLDYLGPEHEQAIILKKHPTLDKGIVEKMVKVAGLVRQSYQQGAINLTVSPRTLLNWGRKTLVWGDVKVAFTIAYLDKLRDSDRKVVLELYGKVFGR